MGLYSDWIFPRLMDRILRRQEVSDVRKRILRDAVEPVLELGFGTGLNLSCYPDGVGKITAVDLRPPHLAFVRDRIARAKVGVELQPGDAGKLPMASGSIATVVTTWLLCSVTHPDSVLAEIRRVLRLDGRYLFIEHGLSPDPRQRRLQQLLTPITRICGCGCTLTRPIPALIASAGLDICTLEELDLSALGRASGHLFLGVARP
ncbi:MAG: class I SAM-dependent methyltransferase [Polyangia bacterium]|jgi:ubiquinone/menaquinone biosynthesis C-methylase UbiE